MVTAERLLKNKIARQLKVCQRGIDKALQLQKSIDYLSHNKALVMELNCQLHEVQAYNQAKDALLQQYVREYRSFNKDFLAPITNR